MTDGVCCLIETTIFQSTYLGNSPYILRKENALRRQQGFQTPQRVLRLNIPKRYRKHLAYRIAISQQESFHPERLLLLPTCQPCRYEQIYRISSFFSLRKIPVMRERSPKSWLTNRCECSAQSGSPLSFLLGELQLAKLKAFRLELVRVNYEEIPVSSDCVHYRNPDGENEPPREFPLIGAHEYP